MLTLAACGSSSDSAPSFAAPRHEFAGMNLDYATIGDLNGDEKPDLAAAITRSDVVSVFLNRGDGSFRARDDFHAKGYPAAVAIADLNGDGRPDVASADAETSVSVLASTGDGSFRPPLTFQAGPAPGSIAIGDLNGDLKPDLAVAGVNGQPAVV